LITKHQRWSREDSDKIFIKILAAISKSRPLKKEDRESKEKEESIDRREKENPEKPDKRNKKSLPNKPLKDSLPSPSNKRPRPREKAEEEEEEKVNNDVNIPIQLRFYDKDGFNKIQIYIILNYLFKTYT